MIKHAAILAGWTEAEINEELRDAVEVMSTSEGK